MTPEQPDSNASIVNEIADTIDAMGERFHAVEKRIRALDKLRRPHQPEPIRQLADTVRDLISVKIPALELQMSTLYRNTELANKRSRDADPSTQTDNDRAIQLKIQPTLTALHNRISHIESLNTQIDAPIPLNMQTAIQDHWRVLLNQQNASDLNIDARLDKLESMAQHTHYHHATTGLPIVLAQPGDNQPDPEPITTHRNAPRPSTPAEMTPG